MGIECICRSIYSEDYADANSLRLRILDSDFKCGQCQLRYMLDSTSSYSLPDQDSANSV